MKAKRNARCKAGLLNLSFIDTKIKEILVGFLFI
jgi:hypothetical protein